MAEKKVKQFKPFRAKPQDKTLKEEEVLRLIDAYINSPSFRLRTGSFSSEADGWALEADGTFTTSQQIISTLADGGDPPLVIASTVLVSNLNVDQVDGFDLNQDVTTAGSPTFATLTLSADLNHDGSNIGFFGTAPTTQASAYTRNATIVESRTLLASASATVTNNNNVLAALIADLQAYGLLQ